MTISFGHATHVATVWLPQLTPTTTRAISTLVAMLAMATILTGVSALFAVFCLEKAFTGTRVIATFLAMTALTFLCAGGLQRVTGTNDVTGATPADSRAAALTAARHAATPEHSWKVGAREVSAIGRTVQTGWNEHDLRLIGAAVARSQGMKLGYAGAPALIETTPMSEQDIARHGTSYVRDGNKVRCVVRVGHVVKNNVGQPVSGTITQVRCAPATAP